MNIDFNNLDRECPTCEKMSLLEADESTWKCHNPECGAFYDVEFLDAAEE